MTRLRRTGRYSWHRRVFDYVGKGAFIRMHGRSAWERIPSSYRVKHGKREYVAREAIDDNVWLAENNR